MYTNILKQLDGKIDNFLNCDPAPRRQKKRIKYDDHLDLVINKYNSYNTVFKFLKVVAEMI